MKKLFKITFPLTLINLLLISGIAGQDNQGFSAPLTPTIFATVEHKKIFLSWDNTAESSIDSLTGYADFEGYRIYRSTDGGETWGGADDRLYNYNGNFIGWRPYIQFDLSAEEDIEFCMDSNGCENGGITRGESISGPDPMNPRVNLGNNTGLAHSFIDSSVFDGIDYTYVITAYDMGLRTYTIEYTDDDDDGIYIADTVWAASNPNHVLGIDESGYKSLESPIGSSEADKNVVVATPGYYASNIWFPDLNNVDTLFVEQPYTIGTGGKTYAIVDRYELTDELLKFEIQADLGDDAVEFMACENPLIYVYEIDNVEMQTPVSISASYETSELTQAEIDSLIDLPGVTENGGTLFIPEYKIITPAGEISDRMSGVQFNFENMPAVVPDEVPIDGFYWSGDTVFSIYTLKGFNSLRGSFEYKDQAAYNRRLNFDYLIEFFDTPRGDTVANSSCQSFPTVLPFRIKNLTTGRKVNLTHRDWGVLGVLPPNYELGAFDCMWTRNEEITFKYDTLETANGLEAINTFFLKIDIPVYDLIGDSLAWSATGTYLKNNVVYYKAMMWLSKEDVIGDEPTAEFYDLDGDGENDNPWTPYYPWNDGDSLIIRTEKFFTDGDSWIVDMSLLGRKQEVTESKLKNIKVVPNPYLSRSGFQETTGERRLRFTQLPTKCRITVYTVTGELVTVIDHEDDYESNEWWNLQTGKNHDGPVIAPGLYIFVVEADGLEHIGKFAVVR